MKSYTITVNGNAAGGSFDIYGYGSADMYLNIPYTYDIEIAGGTFSIDNYYRLMPGSVLTVVNGAALDINGGLQVMDAWVQYDKSGKEYPSAAVLAANGFSRSARLLVNGTLNIDGVFAGIVQTAGNTGKIICASDSTLNGGFFGGSVGGYTDNRVDYTLSARVNTGELRALEKGRTYSAAAATGFEPI